MAATLVRRIPPQRLIDAVNPLVRWILRSRVHRLLDRMLVVLHVVGRRTGRVYRIPVGYLESGGRLWVVTQHRWRSNLRGGGVVEVTARGRRVEMTATLEEDPDRVAEIGRQLIQDLGWRRVCRWLGLQTDSATCPTAATLAAAVREFDLALVGLDPPGPASAGDEPGAPAG